MTSSARGFSLIEALVAMSIITVAVASLSQLVTIAMRSNAKAKSTTFASLLAVQKMEQLRGLTWGFDADGRPLTDTTTGGSGLTASPPGALLGDVDLYCDYLDANGAPLGGGTTPPARTAYIRRWSIDPLPANPDNTLVIQVLVLRNRSAGPRLPDDAPIVSVKTRKES